MVGGTDAIAEKPAAPGFSNLGWRVCPARVSATEDSVPKCQATKDPGNIVLCDPELSTGKAGREFEFCHTPLVIAAMTVFMCPSHFHY